MKIFVCIKQVPDTETRIKIAQEGNGIVTEGIKYVVNPYDEFALEEAIRIKEQNPGSEVTVVTVGPERAREALRSCLAVGADKAVLLRDDSGSLDNLAVAWVLSRHMSDRGPDLIFTGLQAVDDNMAQVGGSIAAFLKLDFVAGIVKIDVGKAEAVVSREAEGGVEVIRTSLPAVFSAQKGLNEPRYPSLMGTMQAKKKPIEEIEAGSLLKDITPSRIKTLRMFYPPERPAGRILSGEPPEVVSELVRCLREEVKLL
ncbi:MAG: electron transfer flavoprotein subunit beta/FixA family protein [bacterium]